VNLVPDPSPGIVVVSPHLDDAVLSCFSALEPGTRVVTVFAGLPPSGMLGAWDAKTGASDSRARVIERRLEDVRAMRLAGCEPIQLDFEDSQYWRRSGLKGLVRRSGSTPPSHDALVAALRPYLETARQVYAPAGIGHVQHSMARDAALAIRRDVSLYADVPYVLAVAPEELELPTELAGVAHRRRDEVQLGSRAALKIAATECYATQIPALEIAFAPFVGSERYLREVIWDTETASK